MENDQVDTTDRILRAAYRLFYRQGVARVSVDAIAEGADVTKRTVYYHFNSKDEILSAVMEAQHFHLINQYQSWLEPSSCAASEIVVGLFSKLRDWADDPDWLGSGFSRVAAELAGMPGHPARKVARLHKAAVETWLAEQLAATGVSEADRLARQVFLLIEGSMSLALIHGDTHYISSAKDAAERLVEKVAT